MDRAEFDHLSDTAREAATSAASSAASTLSELVRALVRAVMAIPMLLGRAGTVAGKAGVHAGTAVGTLSTWLASGSDRARTALESAREVDVRELRFEAPRVLTKREQRRERRRRLGLYALVAGAAAGAGAGIAHVVRRKREEQALADEELWADPAADPYTANGRPEATGGDEVIDVSAAER